MKRLVFVLLTTAILLSNSEFIWAQPVERLHPDLQDMADAILASNAGTEAEIKDSLYKSLVFAFVKHNQTEVVQRLIQHDQNLNIRDTNGNTLLHLAASYGHEDLVSLLIARGIKLDALNKSNWSALYEASLGNHQVVVKKLLSAGADVNGNSKIYSPLNTAAWYGYTGIVRQLLSNGADVSQRDVDGNTALHKAVWQGQFQTVPLLLAAGADKEITNDVGQTPLSMAKERNEQSMKSDDGYRPWGTEQLLGPPDAGNGYSQLEWCPSTANGEKEWVELFYDKAVVPAHLELYTKPAPKSVVKVTMFDEKGIEQIVWNSKDLEAAEGKPAHVSLINVKSNFKCNHVKIYINANRVSGWIYYDAVGLIDADGRKHWAVWAKASTCYAPGEMPVQKHRLVFKLLNGSQTHR